ncbi:MAG: hypothetical protein HY617_04080 [Candidatus Sungbacteria bacterium]|nr:hypothetical protein [Candidatus Sungbacteria bacterium]
MSKSKIQILWKLEIKNWKFRFHRKTAGYVALTATLLVMIISLTIVGGFTFFAVQEVRTNAAFTKSVESRYIAEGGIEDMVYRVVSGKQYSASETLDVGNGTTTITVSTAGTQKTVRSAGKRDNFQQNLETKITVTTDSISFHYGIQVGDGGLDIAHNEGQVVGNVYSNGNVTGSGSVTGDVIVAGGISATSSYSWEMSDADQAFATTTGSRDIAQSFLATSTGALNRVSVYIKKAGNPANDLTLHIAADNGGKPSTASLASATISKSSIGASESWINVSFETPTNVVSGNTYWIVLDYGSNSGTNYWIWRKDTSDAYSNNTGKYADDWDSGSAAWKNTNADLDFKIWIGGVSTKIEGISIGASGGTSKGRANVFEDVTINGASCPNSDCIIENPIRQEFAITDGLIQDWKNDAACSGCTVINGNYTVSGSQSIGPAKITGDLTFENGATLTIAGTLWVQGEIDFANNCHLNLASGYGTLSGVVVGDDEIDVANNCTFGGSGTSGSYVLLVSAKNTPSSQVMDVSNNSTGVIYFAPHGRIHLSNNATAKEVTAYGIDMDKAVVTYESGLANLQFSSGPAGGYSIDEWQQVP